MYESFCLFLLIFSSPVYNLTEWIYWIISRFMFCNKHDSPGLLSLFVSLWFTFVSPSECVLGAWWAIEIQVNDNAVFVQGSSVYTNYNPVIKGKY